MEITDFIPDGPKVGVNVKNNDFQDENGIWHCGKCGKPKQKRIDTELFHKTVWCLCDCEAKKLADEKRRQEYEEEMRRVQRLKDASMMDDKYRKASFSSYMVREENKKAFQTARAYVRDFQTMIKDGHPKTGEKNIGLVFYGKWEPGRVIRLPV